jgi:chemotaxis receptor (MCP) glutamine deamidase CheD
MIESVSINICNIGKFMIRSKGIFFLLITIFWTFYPYTEAFGGRNGRRNVDSERSSSQIHHKVKKQHILHSQKHEEKRETQTRLPESKCCLDWNNPYTYIFCGLLITTGVIGTYAAIQSGKSKTPLETPPFVPTLSTKNTLISLSDRAAPSSYFSLHDPIPQQNRSTLFVDLEKSYRQAEACEPDTVSVLETLPSSHPFREYLKQCDEINAHYKSPEILPTLKIPFDKTTPSSQFKVVPQFSYSTSTDEILFTGNVMKCVAIAIHNPKLGIGGLAHIAGENLAYFDKHLQSTEKSKTGIHEFMESVTGTENPAGLKVTLLSGSKAHLEYYVSLMKKFGFVNFNIVQKNEWGSNKNSFYKKNLSKGSLALDPTDGRVYRIENDKLVGEWMGPPTAFPTLTPLKLKKAT